MTRHHAMSRKGNKRKLERIKKKRQHQKDKSH